MTHLAPDPDEWRRDAACNGADPGLFFPRRGDNKDAAAAKAICAECAVINECLEYALTNRETVGIWGGLSERQRRRIRGTRPSAPRPSTSADVLADLRRNGPASGAAIADRTGIPVTRVHTSLHHLMRNRGDVEREGYYHTSVYRAIDRPGLTEVVQPVPEGEGYNGEAGAASTARPLAHSPQPARTTR